MDSTLHGKTMKLRPARVQDAPQAAMPAPVTPSMKAFGFLEAVARAQRPLSIPEFSAFLSIPQPTAHRIVHTLVEEGMLARELGSRRYGPGDRLARLSFGLIAASMRLAPRHALLEALSGALGETCNLGAISGNNLVYLDRVEAAWPLGLRFEPGSRVPLHCTSMGKLLLSFLSPQGRQRLLGVAPLYQYTANTITERPNLEEELWKIRESEISTDDQEFLAGVVCVAVPIRAAGGNVVAAIAVSAPAARMSLARGLEHVGLLRDAASKIEATLANAAVPAARARASKKRRGDRQEQIKTEERKC